MIPLFCPRRGRLLAAVVTVALIQLGATVTVAHALHRPAAEAWSMAAIAAVLGFACEALLRRLSEGLGLDYVAVVRDALFRHLMSVDPQVIGQRRHGAVLQSFVGDLTALRQWVAEGIMRAILAVIALIGLLAWLCVTTPSLGLMALAVVAAACAGGSALLVPLSRTVQNVRRERGRVSAFASQRLAASATVLACARAGSEARRLDRRVARLNAASLRRAWLTGVLRALPHLAATAIVIAAVMTSGPAGSGMAGQVLVIGIIGLALRDLARAVELAIPGRISQRRVARLLAIPSLGQAAAKPWVRGEKRSLVMDGLVTAPGAAPVTARADKGDIVQVEGNPRLVTALFRTLSGLAVPIDGSVRWNGADLCARRPSQRRAIVGLASGDLPVLPGSHGFNLRYRSPAIADEELRLIAREWDIDLQAQDGGGSNNSHRLVLARALLGKPPVLLLAPDDRALDNADLLRLAKTIGDWPGVVLIVSRHPALAGSATRRWVLSAEDGLSEPVISHHQERAA